MLKNQDELWELFKKKKKKKVRSPYIKGVSQETVHVGITPAKSV